MAGMKLSTLDFVRLLPAFMRDDEAAIALSKAVDELIGKPSKRIPTIRTWDQFDNLSAEDCDEMAWEQDVDWYDPEGMTLEQKRETLKFAQQIKSKRGTKWAVERLITAYFGEGYVLEWYEMDGEPFTFVALTTNAEISADGYQKFIKAAQAAKNERSHMTGVYYFWQQGPDPGIEYAMGYSSYTYPLKKCGTTPRRAVIGALLKADVQLEPEVQPYTYDLTAAGSTHCGVYPRPGTIGAAVKDGVAAEPEADAILYGFERQAGTYPRPGTIGKLEDHPITTAPVISFEAYGFVKCGTRRCGE